MMVLGFIKRRVKELQDEYLCKTLYCALVQPIVEYASVVWSPQFEVDCNRIESVQKQFLIFALRHLGFTGFHLPPYESRLLLLDMTTLKKRRECASAVLIFDLIKDKIKSDSLKNRIEFVVPRYPRRANTVYRTLKEEFCATGFSENDAIARAIRDFNTHADCFDSNITRDTFKNRINKKFRKLYVQ